MLHDRSACDILYGTTISDQVRRRIRTSTSLWPRGQLDVPLTTYAGRSLVRSFALLLPAWNSLPHSLKGTVLSLSCVQNHLATFLLSRY